jgi:hypothetical protein
VKSFRSIAVPSSAEDLPRVLRLVQQAIEQAASREAPSLEMQVLYAAPTKTFPAMLVYADGVTWNPGSGEGLYRRDKTNASWVFIG